MRLPKNILCRTAGLILFVLLSAETFAHESRPAYLEITEIQPHVYSVIWKRPQQGGRSLALHPVWPDGVRDLTPPTQQLLPTAVLEQRTIAMDGAGLIGQTLSIEGLASTLTDVLVRIQLLDGRTQTTLVKPSSPTFTVQAAQSRWQIAKQYLVLGIEHILGGIDHLLFVLALLLLVSGRWLLLKTITAFTIAHSITLAMATLGFVRVPAAPVEAVIALSILFLASELARRKTGQTGLTERYPWVVSFTFGLLHGFGFAGALAEIGLPQKEIPLALFQFNVGVELGQLMFVAAALSVSVLLQKLKVDRFRWAREALVYGIGCVAAFWCIQRVVSFVQ